MKKHVSACSDFTNQYWVNDKIAMCHCFQWRHIPKLLTTEDHSVHINIFHQYYSKCISFENVCDSHFCCFLSPPYSKNSSSFLDLAALTLTLFWDLFHEIPMLSVTVLLLSTESKPAFSDCLICVQTTHSGAD